MKIYEAETGGQFLFHVCVSRGQANDINPKRYNITI